MNKKFLLISYDFPPLNTGGSHRPARFATYLKEKHGLNPVVITVDHELQSNVNTDLTLSKNLPEDIVIHKTNIKSHGTVSNMINSGYFFNTDSILYRWKKHLKKEIKKAIEKYKPAFIFLSVPPFSLLNFVRKTAKKFDIPLIFDFRDPLSFWNSSPFASKMHYLYFKRIEKKCIEESYKTLVVSPEMKNLYSAIYPESKDKFEVIFNSFDNYATVKKEKPNNKFVIGYSGSFYYDSESERLIKAPWWKKKPYQYFQFVPFNQDWKYRSPHYFFMALSILIKQNPQYNENIEIQFAGKKPIWFDNMVSEFELNNVVIHKGFLSKEEINVFNNSCDAFLATSAKFINWADYCIAGKTYEYLSFSKPIVAFVPEGDQKWIIKNSGLGIICDPDHEEWSATKLKQLIDKKIEVKPNRAFIDEFLTEKQVEKLFKIIEPLIKPKP